MAVVEIIELDDDNQLIGIIDKVYNLLIGLNKDDAIDVLKATEKRVDDFSFVGPSPVGE